MTQRRAAGHPFASLESKLPVLIGGLVAAALLGILLLVRYELRSSATAAAGERLQRAGVELATAIAQGMDGRILRYDSVAAMPEVVAFATGRSDDLEAVRAALDRLRANSDRGLPIQLRALDGSVRALTGASAESAEGPVSPEPVRGDSLRFSSIQPLDDRLSFWVSIPIRSGNTVVGHITQQRATGGTQTLQFLENLIGGDIRASIHLANADGGEVYSFEGKPLNVSVAPPADSVYTYQMEGGEQKLAYAAPIRRTPWLLLVDMPKALTTLRADDVTQRLAFLSLVLLLIGLTAAWLVSRSVTRPLRKLGATADAIAAGDYSRRTDLDRTDEIGHLARSFDDMARHVGAAHDELERRYEHAQSLAIELELANARLQDAIGDAESARSEAQHASTAKSQFLATMSHEIRTPINAIIGYTDLMDLELPGPLTDQQHDYVRRIRVSGEHLISVVNEVLDFAKIESGQMRVAREVCSARFVIETAISMLHARAAEKAIVVDGSYSNDDLFLGDPQRVQQVLLNLLENALKFTPEGGRVTLRCAQRGRGPAGAHRRPAVWTCISVVDSGIGVAADQRERIFEPFVQGAAGYTRPHGGTGLGLAISRSLARMMDGDLTVESKPGVGATFTLWLPHPSNVAVAAN